MPEKGSDRGPSGGVGLVHIGIGGRRGLNAPLGDWSSIHVDQVHKIACIYHDKDAW